MQLHADVLALVCGDSDGAAVESREVELESIELEERYADLLLSFLNLDVCCGTNFSKRAVDELRIVGVLKQKDLIIYSASYENVAVGRFIRLFLLYAL